MAAFSDSFGSRSAGVPATTQRSGSISDLYPKAIAIQRIAAARSVAVLSVNARTALANGTLTVRMQSPEEDTGLSVSHLLGAHSAVLQTHLWVSPIPLKFDMQRIGLLPPMEFESEYPPEERPEFGLAFPVPLGAMGNGYLVLCGVEAELDADSCIDLHRKSISLMREALKLDFGSVATAEALSDREIECLQLVGDGLKSEAIGERLGLSVHTVNAYLGSATTKLDAVNRIQAIAKAIRLGLIS